MWCVSTWLVCLEPDCLVLLSAEGPTGGLVLSRDQAENNVNQQGLKTGPSTARRKMGYGVGQYKRGILSLASVTMFFVLGIFLKGKETSDYSKMLSLERHRAESNGALK